MSLGPWLQEPGERGGREWERGRGEREGEKGGGEGGRGSATSFYVGSSVYQV